MKDSEQNNPPRTPGMGQVEMEPQSLMGIFASAEKRFALGYQQKNESWTVTS